MDGDNIPFLITMTLYYMFSAIIMLNVLIGNSIGMPFDAKVYYTATDEEISAFNEKYSLQGDIAVLQQDNLSDKKSPEEMKLDKLQKDFDEMKIMLMQLLTEKRETTIGCPPSAIEE
ncbi:hypothetical protein EDD21DRAFT_350056 [Dissophora ornata]|nr:hypothetical protein EDD21DRAFT_350056 [Dissophora ornata]